MMVDEALAEVIQSPPQNQPIFSSTFDLYINEQHYPNVITSLYDYSIVIALIDPDAIEEMRTTYLEINFTFELIFEMLRKGENEQNGGPNAEPVGIRFQRFDQILVLKGKTDKEELIKWRDQLGKKLNQRGFHELFKPIKKIGKGNFASVYLVIKHEDGKKYAVKAFSKQGTFSEQKGKESLINQLQIMRRFDHKNLMKLNGVYESQNSIYASVQMLEGGQLCDKIKNRHKFTSLEIKLVMKGILQGLQVMHAQNIMHRDLKPENILLRKDGDYDCVIADFGLSESAFNNPYLFVRCGTPGYVAPEVVNLKDLQAKYDPICDLFSVGVIFHILAIRKPPFPGKQYNEVLAQNRACEINFQAPEYLNLPEIWLNLMKRLLQKDPTKRITASEALEHEFFSKDNMFAEFSKQRTTLKESQGPRQFTAEQCMSPLLMTKNNSRKNPKLLREDSCLKFKMKQNLLTGRTEQGGETVDEIDSPGLKKRPSRAGGVESRFKRMAK